MHRAPETRESWRTRAWRVAFNCFPAYRGTGARVTHIAHDWSEVHVRLPLSWRTRNYVGTIFGGSMYGAIDPVYMMMLIKALGPEYIVWDKAANIRFRRPGKSPLFAVFVVTKVAVAEIRSAVEQNGKTEREFSVDLVDARGQVHATCEKLLSIRARSAATH